MRGRAWNICTGLVAAIGICCVLGLTGCQNQRDTPSQSDLQSQTDPAVSISQPSSQTSESSSQSQSIILPSSVSSSAPLSMSSVPPASTSQSEISSSSEPGGGTDVPIPPESQELSLWQLADVAFEKRTYGAETSRVYFRLYNRSDEAMYIMRDYEVEKLEGGQWIPLGTHRLDSQSIQYAVEPGKNRLIGVPVDWLKEPNQRYGDDRIPDGSYRLRVYINQHFWRTVPFEIQKDPLEEDTSLYEVHTINEVYLTVSESVNYEVINKTEQELSFSYRCFLEYLEEGVWKRFEGSGGPDFIIIVEPNSVMRETFSLEPFRPLEPGRYRLVKTLARNTYYAPFTLVESLEQIEQKPTVSDDSDASENTEPPFVAESSQESPKQTTESETSSSSEADKPVKTEETANLETDSSEVNDTNSP